MKKRINAGIIGGAGYTGGETLRLLINHDLVHVRFSHSLSQTGKLVSDVHTDLLGETTLRFSDGETESADVLFLCLGHGEAKKYLASNPPKEDMKIIDLSQDHRLTVGKGVQSWTYGLPELNREAIAKSTKVSNPGCFATCIQLALLPLAYGSHLNADMHVSATTGSTGAGQNPTADTHFSWRQNNLSPYKVFTHQHLPEIRQSLLKLQPDLVNEIHFVPLRGSFTRGILAGIYLETDLSIDQALELYKAYYANHPFVHISEKVIDLKQVINTNKCILHLEKQGTRLLITGIIDNLLKGASGQAVQNMNLMFGFAENSGLKLKASAF